MTPAVSYAERMRREWLRTDVSRRFERLDRAIATSRQATLDYAHKRSPLGRQRALAKLKRAFVDAQPEAFAGGVALWSFLKPGSAADWTTADDHPRDRQGCIRVYFLLCDGTGSHTGLWSLEFTDHTIGRLVSDARSPLALGAVETMHAAHRNLLSRSAAAVLRWPEDWLLAVEDGVFRCSLTRGPAGTDQLFLQGGHVDSRRHVAREPAPGPTSRQRGGSDGEPAIAAAVARPTASEARGVTPCALIAAGVALVIISAAGLAAVWRRG